MRGGKKRCLNVPFACCSGTSVAHSFLTTKGMQIFNTESKSYARKGFREAEITEKRENARAYVIREGYGRREVKLGRN